MKKWKKEGWLSCICAEDAERRMRKTRRAGDFAATSVAGIDGCRRRAFAAMAKSPAALSRSRLRKLRPIKSTRARGRKRRTGQRPARNRFAAGPRRVLGAARKAGARAGGAANPLRLHAGAAKRQGRLYPDDTGLRPRQQPVINVPQ